MNISPHLPHPPSQISIADSINRQAIAAMSPISAAPAADTVTLSPSFQTGKDNMLSLGALALGGQHQLQSWSEKGLEISDVTIERAYDTFNQGFKESIQDKGQSSLAINRYDIVANYQSVPGWFHEEKQLFLDTITDPDLKASFESGNFYHVTNAPSGPSARQLNTYNEIAKG